MILWLCHLRGVQSSQYFKVYTRDGEPREQNHEGPQDHGVCYPLTAIGWGRGDFPWGCQAKWGKGSFHGEGTLLGGEISCIVEDGILHVQAQYAKGVTGATRHGVLFCAPLMEKCAPLMGKVWASSKEIALENTVFLLGTPSLRVLYGSLSGPLEKYMKILIFYKES